MLGLTKDKKVVSHHSYTHVPTLIRDRYTAEMERYSKLTDCMTYHLENSITPMVPVLVSVNALL